MNTSGRSLLAFTTNEPPISSTVQGGGKRSMCADLLSDQRVRRGATRKNFLGPGCGGCPEILPNRVPTPGARPRHRASGLLETLPCLVALFVDGMDGIFLTIWQVRIFPGFVWRTSAGQVDPKPLGTPEE